ncbi:MAG: calcium-translocating P-type ATPase, PMCA-type [Bacillota bacterium]
MKPYFAETAENTMAEFNTSTNGLSAQEAAARLEKNGINALAEGAKKSAFMRFMAQFKDVMIIVLIVAAAVSAAMCIIENLISGTSEYAELIDSGIILLIVIINAVIGFIQENKAEASMEALKNMNKPFAKVMRDGVVVKVKSEELVVGDIVLLEAGDIVPADIRLIESASLKVEEAALTGESVPSEKNPDVIENEKAALGDRNNMCFSTGVVSYGRGMGVIVATGMATEVGKIATMLQEDTSSETPLQAQLAKTAKMLSVLVLGIAAVIFAVIMIRGFVDSSDPDIFGLISGAFMIAVAIAVAAIPEGLPAVVTIVLALGVQRMSDRKAIVRNLPSVEALGCCEVICSDKTGTLTLNQMTVKELFTLETGSYKAQEEPTSHAADILVRGMALCNDTKRSGANLVGDPTETALIAYADTLGLTTIQESYARVEEKPFDSIRKLMTTINTVDGSKVAHIKGAPDLLIDACTKILENGVTRDITADDVAAIKQANSAMAVKALRVLAVAIKTEELDLETVETGMTFVGLVGMIDPPRAEVKDAVAVCYKAGMRAIMITGDHADTATAIAKEIGILQEGQRVITGADLDKLSDEEFKSQIFDISVYARVSPENKVRIVKTFKECGKKVAMTGDGVNDAPSIKAADIGVGMGITGTDVSKGASDMVLADDNFATIVSAVEEGRKVYANIKKAVQYLLSANIAEVMCLFVITLIGLQEHFLTAVMILWVNLVTDSLPALALGMEKAELDIMDYPPRKSGSSLFAGKTGVDIIIQGCMQTALVLASFFIGDKILGANDASFAEARTMAFLTLCFIQLFHGYNVRSQNQSLFASNPFGNKFMNLSFFVGAALVLVVVLVPGLNTWFSATMIDWKEWLTVIALSACIIPMVEMQKLIERIIAKKRNG